jgi:hypothetical protein
MKKIVIVIAAVLLGSCVASVEQKKSYTYRRLKDLEKYGSIQVIEVSLESDSSVFFRTHSKKFIKNELKNTERVMALIPDTVEVKPGTSDSLFVYRNPAKVKYIKRHHLVTPRTILNE